jgi:hypothetical protein
MRQRGALLTWIDIAGRSVAGPIATADEGALRPPGHVPVSTLALAHSGLMAKIAVTPLMLAI